MKYAKCKKKYFKSFSRSDNSIAIDLFVGFGGIILVIISVYLLNRYTQRTADTNHILETDIDRLLLGLGIIAIGVSITTFIARFSHRIYNYCCGSIDIEAPSVEQFRKPEQSISAN